MFAPDEVITIHNSAFLMLKKRNGELVSCAGLMTWKHWNEQRLSILVSSLELKLLVLKIYYTSELSGSICWKFLCLEPKILIEEIQDRAMFFQIKFCWSNWSPDLTLPWKDLPLSGPPRECGLLPREWGPQGLWGF